MVTYNCVDDAEGIGLPEEFSVLVVMCRKGRIENPAFLFVRGWFLGLFRPSTNVGRRKAKKEGDQVQWKFSARLLIPGYRLLILIRRKGRTV